MAIKMVVVCDVCGDVGWSQVVTPGHPSRAYAAAREAMALEMNGRRWEVVDGKLCCSIRCRHEAREPPRCSCERPVNPANDRRGDGPKCLVCGGDMRPRLARVKLVDNTLPVGHQSETRREAWKRLQEAERLYRAAVERSEEAKHGA